MIVPRDRVRHLAATAGLIAVILPLAVVLLSVALSPASNWTVRTALAGFCILAVARPDAALLVTIAFAGFGIILSHLAGVPDLRVTEVLVVASLAGCCVRALPHVAPFRRALAGWISAPVVLFAIAAAASTVVWQRVYQAETGYPSAYVQALLLFVSRDYFFQPGDFQLLVSTAVILEGLALYVVFAALCQLDPTFFGRALRMLTLGGAGLAVLSAVRLGEILLRNPGAIEALRATSVGLRISPQIPDYIAAGLVLRAVLARDTGHRHGIAPRPPAVGRRGCASTRRALPYGVTVGYCRCPWRTCGPGIHGCAPEDPGGSRRGGVCHRCGRSHGRELLVDERSRCRRRDGKTVVDGPERARPGRFGCHRNPTTVRCRHRSVFSAGGRVRVARTTRPVAGPHEPTQ